MKKHSERKHAKLSASGADRWLNCTASVRLEEAFPRASSIYADEGTLAHEFGDYFLRWQNGEITQGRYMEAVAKLRKHELYNKEMDGEVGKYTTYVLEQFSELRRNDVFASLWVEARLDFSEYVPDGFGTGDAVLAADGILEIVDLKYGRGVEVSPTHNPQLMLYALGAYLENSLSYDIQTVKITVAQVRLNNISSFEFSASYLLEWAENEVRPKAKLAYNGEGETVAGDHCRWCSAKATCRAFAELANEAAKFDFADPATLTDEELITLFENAPKLSEWLKAVNAYMHDEALNGKKWAGYKMVEGSSKRRWGNEEEVIDELADLGFEPKDYLNTKLKGLKEIGDLMSRDAFDDRLKKHVVKPSGAPCLVSEDDKRPEIGVESAIRDFTEEDDLL